MISAKCINKLCELGMRITCPFCDTASFSFIKNNKEVCEYLKGKPPILQVVPHHTSNQFSSLIDPDIILALLLNDDECCPGNIPLCCLQEESFPKDAQIAMESVLIVPLAIRGIMGGLKALYNVNKGKDNKNVVIRYRDEQGKCYEQTARLELPDDTK
ncbi:MAG TPA: hypothetical protein PKA28_13160 [Methylomusa anaerophila]|uniref:hypothetical protein n=1 Tax=Methylomusa anaerophila TaxID=1930071 RepID=UPI000F826C6D|nr:hypothetical protein [Methylomusa anaerophila]HML89383.1 hypothetical protein [Methylomusa anaerophila]